MKKVIDPAKLLSSNTREQLDYYSTFDNVVPPQRDLAKLGVMTGPMDDDELDSKARDSVDNDQQFVALIRSLESGGTDKDLITRIVKSEIDKRKVSIRQSAIDDIARSAVDADPETVAAVQSLEAAGAPKEQISAFVKKEIDKRVYNLESQFAANSVAATKAVEAGGGTMFYDYQSLTPGDTTGTTPYKLRPESALRLAAKEIGGQEGVLLHRMSLQMQQLPGDKQEPDTNATPEMLRAIDAQYADLLGNPKLSSRAKQAIEKFGRRRYGAPEEAWEGGMGTAMGVLNVAPRTLGGVITGTQEAMSDYAKDEGIATRDNILTRAGAGLTTGIRDTVKAVSTGIRGGGEEDSPAILDTQFAARNPKLAAAAGVVSELGADVTELINYPAALPGGTLTALGGGSAFGVPSYTIPALTFDFSAKGRQARLDILKNVGRNIASAVSGGSTDPGTIFAMGVSVREQFMKQAFEEAQKAAGGGMPRAEDIEKIYRQKVDADLASVAIDNPHEAQFLSDALLDIAPYGKVAQAVSGAVKGTGKLGMKAINAISPEMGAKSDAIARDLWRKFSNAPYDADALARTIDSMHGPGKGEEFLNALEVGDLRAQKMADDLVTPLRDMVNEAIPKLDQDIKWYDLPATRRDKRAAAYDRARKGLEDDPAAMQNKALAEAQQGIREGEDILNWQARDVDGAAEYVPASVRKVEDYAPAQRQNLYPEMDKRTVESKMGGGAPDMEAAAEKLRKGGDPLKHLPKQWVTDVNNLQRVMNVSKRFASQVKVALETDIGQYAPDFDTMKRHLERLSAANPDTKYAVIGLGRGTTANLGDDAARIIDIEAQKLGYGGAVPLSSAEQSAYADDMYNVVYESADTKVTKPPTSSKRTVATYLTDAEPKTNPKGSFTLDSPPRLRRRTEAEARASVEADAVANADIIRDRAGLKDAQLAATERFTKLYDKSREYIERTGKVPPDVQAAEEELKALNALAPRQWAARDEFIRSNDTVVASRSPMEATRPGESYLIVPQELAIHMRDTIDLLGNTSKTATGRAVETLLNSWNTLIGGGFKVGATLGRMFPYMYRNLNTALLLPAAISGPLKTLGHTREAVAATVMAAIGGEGSSTVMKLLNKPLKLADGSERTLAQIIKDLEDSGFLNQALDRLGTADMSFSRKLLGGTVFGTAAPTFGNKRLARISNLQMNNNIENIQKILTYMNFLEGSSPAAINKALVLTRKYAGHFRNLTGFERDVMTKIAPFWAWTKYASTGLAEGIVKKPTFTIAAQRWAMYKDKRNRNLNRQFSRETMPEWSGEFATMADTAQQPDDYRTGQAVSLHDTPASIAFWWMNGERGVASLLGPHLPIFAYETMTGRDWETDKPSDVQPTLTEQLSLALSHEKGWNPAEAGKFLKAVGTSHPAIAALTSPIRPMTEDLSLMMRAIAESNNPRWEDEVKLQWAIGNRLPLFRNVINLWRDYKGLPRWDKGGVGISNSFLTDTPEEIVTRRSSGIISDAFATNKTLKQ